jgi:hypothetical protein
MHEIKDNKYEVSRTDGSRKSSAAKQIAINKNGR